MRNPVVSARATRYKSLCGGEWIGGGGENICGGESASGGVGVGGFWSTMVAVWLLLLIAEKEDFLLKEEVDCIEPGPAPTWNANR